MRAVVRVVVVRAILLDAVVVRKILLGILSCERYSFGLFVLRMVGVLSGCVVRVKLFRVVFVRSALF